MIDIRDHGGSYGGSKKKSKYGWEEYNGLDFGAFSARGYSENLSTCARAEHSTRRNITLEHRFDGDMTILSGSDVQIVSSSFSLGQNANNYVPPILLKNGDILSIHRGSYGAINFTFMHSETQYTTSSRVYVGDSNASVPVESFFEFDDYIIFTLYNTPFTLRWLDKTTRSISKSIIVDGGVSYTGSVKWQIDDSKKYLYCHFANYIYKVDIETGVTLSKLYRPIIMNGKILPNTSFIYYRDNEWYIPFKKDSGYEGVPTYFAVVNESGEIVREIELDQSMMPHLIFNGMIYLIGIVDGRYALVCHDTGVWNYYNKAVIIDMYTSKIIKKFRDYSGTSTFGSVGFTNDMLVLNGSYAGREIFQLKIEKKEYAI